MDWVAVEGYGAYRHQEYLDDEEEDEDEEDHETLETAFLKEEKEFHHYKSVKDIGEMSGRDVVSLHIEVGEVMVASPDILVATAGDLCAVLAAGTETHFVLAEGI